MHLIPAHAGVIPGGWAAAQLGVTYPRACGGDPSVEVIAHIFYFLSPRMRG